MGVSKTNQEDDADWKPIKDSAARALNRWLNLSGIERRPLFRRFKLNTRELRGAISGRSVARIIQRRAKLARLDLDLAGHSLRSGFMTEAGKGVHLRDAMQLSGHKSLSTALAYPPSPGRSCTIQQRT